MSQCLAEIVTSFAILKAIKKIEQDKISFLVKFVVDIGGAMDNDTILAFEEMLNGIVDGLTVKRENEDERSITVV